MVLCLHVARSLFCFQGGILPVELMESALANALRVRVCICVYIYVQVHVNFMALFLELHNPF